MSAESEKLTSCQATSSILPQQQKSFQGYSNEKEGSAQEGVPNQPLNIEKMLQRVKSTEELECDFKNNQRLLHSLNFNINDLFKKISQLTQQITVAPETLAPSKQPMKPELQDIQSVDSSKEKACKHNLRSSKTENYLQIQTNPSQNVIQTDDIQFSMADFQTGRTLGYGKFGEVLQCRHLQTGTLYALKKIFKSTVDQYKMENQLLVQLEAQRRLYHPSIVKSYKSMTDPFHIFILMEYATGAQLTKKFKSPQSFVSRVIRQILVAIKYMHECKIVHRDLKPENILIDQINQVVKITDFGWASVDSKQLNILCGTLDYLSPEMAADREYDYRVDLWSVGVLTYELIYGKSPFRASDKKETIENIKSIKYDFPQEKQQDITISESCKDFIKGYLKTPEERMTIEWGLNHKFMSKQDFRVDQSSVSELAKDYEKLI